MLGFSIGSLDCAIELLANELQYNIANWLLKLNLFNFQDWEYKNELIMLALNDLEENIIYFLL